MDYIDHKYILLLSPYLSEFKDQGNRTWRFRCPFCGDSKVSDTKARGYFFLVGDDPLFKCHNCGMATNLLGVIREVVPSLAKDYAFEKFSNNGKTTKPSRPKPPPTRKPKPVSDALVKLTDLPEDHQAVQYIIGRKIPKEKHNLLYAADSIRELASGLDAYKDRKLPDHPCVAIPCRDRGGDLTFYQCRMLGGESRYFNLEVQEGAPNFWGANLVDWNEVVSVTEGTFDALMVDNCMSAGGSGKVRSLVDRYAKDASKGFRIILDPDYRTNPEVWEICKSFIESGHPVVLFDHNFEGEDINDWIKTGVTTEQLNEYLNRRTFTGLSAKLEFSKIRPPGSSKRYRKKFCF